jgi:hypothetical protein
MPSATDNQGNEALISKNMTSKYPLYLVLLELTEQLLKRNVSLDLLWQRRDSNEAADDLTNHCFDKFSEELRVNPRLESLGWIVLPKLMDSAAQLHKHISNAKQQRTLSKIQLKPNSFGKQNKNRKRKADSLRMSDPW